MQKTMVRTDWNTALTHVTVRFAATIAEHGPESVAFCLSGQLLTEDYDVANKLLKGFIDVSNINPLWGVSASPDLLDHHIDMHWHGLARLRVALHDG